MPVFASGMTVVGVDLMVYIISIVGERQKYMVLDLTSGYRISFC